MKKMKNWYMGLPACCRVALVLALFLAGLLIGMSRSSAGEVGAFVAKFDQGQAVGLKRDSDNIGLLFGHTWEDDAVGFGVDGYFFNNSAGQDIYLQWRFDDTLAFRAGVGRMGSNARAVVDVSGADVTAVSSDRADTRWVQATIKVHNNAAVFLRITKATFDYNFTASRAEQGHSHTIVHTGRRADTVDDTYVWAGVTFGF